jgi:hypothetical protein
MNHLPEGLDATRTPHAEAVHTQRIAFAVIVAAGLTLNALLAAILF